MTGSDLLVKALERLGVPQLWGFPGRLPDFADRLRASRIDFIPTRNAQAVAFAADVLGRFANRPAACYASLELDAVNLTTAVANAYMNGAPMLVLLVGASNGAPERQSELLRQMRPMLKLAVTVDFAREIAGALDRAYHAALHGRPGPVVVRLARSALAEPVNETLGITAARPAVLESARSVEYQALRSSRAPLIIAGDEIARMRATEPFRGFVERFEIPVFTTLDAKGVIPEDHPLSLGPLVEGFDEVYEPALSETDLVVLIGVGGGGATGVPASLAHRIEHAQIVHVGGSLPAAPELTHRGPQVVTNLASFLKLLAARNPGPRPARPELYGLADDIRAEASALTKAAGHLTEVLDVLRAHLRPDDVIVCDVSLSAPVGMHYRALRPLSLIFSAPSALGFEVPGAIGIKSLDPGRRVVALSGGSSLMLSVQEIETSVRAGLPIIVILLMSEPGTASARGAAVPLANDFVALVNSFGALAVRTENTEEFARAFHQACAAPLTTVIIAPRGVPDTTSTLPRRSGVRSGS
jgi:acetolactate synthase-1/2/3 large subunit